MRPDESCNLEGGLGALPMLSSRFAFCSGVSLCSRSKSCGAGCMADDGADIIRSTVEFDPFVAGKSATRFWPAGVAK
jgi:hypothetical protein